jgi:hypothetical protein
MQSEIAIAAKILIVVPSAVVSFGLAPFVLGVVTPAVLASVTAEAVVEIAP